MDGRDESGIDRHARKQNNISVCCSQQQHSVFECRRRADGGCRFAARKRAASTATWVAEGACAHAGRASAPPILRAHPRATATLRRADMELVAPELGSRQEDLRSGGGDAEW